MKTAIITGGGSGIGKALAKKLACNNWKVTINGRTKEKLDETAKEIDFPDHVNVFAGDIGDKDQVEAMINNHIERFGRLDGLINNAGVAVSGEISEISEQDWSDVMKTNVDALFHTTKLSLDHLEKTNGAIVNVSSVSGLGGDWGMGPYNASKGAVTNFTRAMALDLATKGIRVNAVAPSLTDTPMASFITEDEEKMEEFKKRIPMQRAAEPAEVADVISFLLSNEARFVNGVILPVDGGLSASNGQPKME
ncbi:MAG: SDR family oxidoreductase [Cyclobacteriaceae bacterium]